MAWSRTHHVMTFYVPPAVPYLPSQWPLSMPVPYNPCLPFQGIGFGVALPQSAYMETPGFVVFPAQLPLRDHRAPNSHYPPSQRFRCQAFSAEKEMVSLGVQTETPFLGWSDPQFSKNIECAGSDSGRGTACSNSTPASSPTFGVCLQERAQMKTTADVRCAPGSACVVGIANGWRQICTPLNELPAGEPYGDGNLVEHDAYPSEGLVPVYASSAHESNLCMDSGKQGEQQSPSCPRVQLGQVLPPSSMDVLHSGCEASQVMLKSATSQQGEEPNKVADYIEENTFKIIKLPFSIQYMVDFKKMANQSMWSESVAIYVPSSEWTLQNELLLSEKEGNITVNDYSKSQDAVTLVGLNQDLPSKSQRESISSDSLPPCIPASSWLADMAGINHYSKLSLAVQEQECILRTPADMFTLRRQNQDSKSCKCYEVEKCKCKKLNWEGSCQSATCISAAKGHCVQCVTGRKIHYWAWKNTDSIQRQMVQSSSLMDRTCLSRAYMRSVPN
ncbi:hypothetical protein Z043_123692 [Scleropages formosus]|uniref:Uncharacterized protein n=1 Tax=Scleropages formosus TaxID=113540 RepID=A0A0P7TLB6_SCLFO|nr:hypothetical protein Z043_123692 [Scleropages formosus]